jgi:hypothetical protein
LVRGLCAAVAQVVAVDAGHHHVLQAHVGDGVGQVDRFLRIRRLGPAVGDVAERTAAGADLAEDHEGRGAVAEALMDVRAAGFLAHGHQAVLAQLGLELGDRIARGDAHADPRRLAQHRRVCELHRRAVDLVAAELFGARGHGGGLQHRRGHDRIGRADDGERDGLAGGVAHVCIDSGD